MNNFIQQNIEKQLFTKAESIMFERVDDVKEMLKQESGTCVGGHKFMYLKDAPKGHILGSVFTYDQDNFEGAYSAEVLIANRNVRNVK
jgi:hypothetical protein